MTAIEITCPGCQKRLRVPRFVPGKMVRCPYCQETHLPEVIETAEPVSEVLHLTEENTALTAAESWQMRTPEKQTFGPVDKRELDEWVREGRITGDCHLLRPGSNAWEWATSIYPHLASVPTGPAGYATAPPASYGMAMSTAAMPRAPKSRLTAFFLALFLGALGLHRFYLGHNNIGLIQLIIFCSSFVTCFSFVVSLIWGWVDAVLILVGAVDRDGDGWPISW